MRTFILLSIFAAAAFAQRHHLEPADRAALQSAIDESDAGRKAALLEQFAAQSPKSTSMAWVLDALQQSYVKTGQHEKIVATGEKLLALDPDDPEAALQNLKASEALKDLPAIRKWVVVASTNARKMVASPQPADAAAIDDWKNEVDYARQVDIYTEYALFRVAAESRDPKVTIEFAEALDQRNPDSRYMAQTRTAQFLAYRMAGENAKAVALAERVLATDQSSEDMLLVVADDYVARNQNPEKVHAYAAKVVELLAAQSVPQGVGEAQWTARKNAMTGVARYLSGKLYFKEEEFAEADRELRAALPLVDANAALKPEVLFDLGFANFKMEKMQDAADFYKACAALAGPYQTQAGKNLQAIKAKYTGVK